MKQSELDRIVKQHCKLEARRYGWRALGDCVYWKDGPLLFVLFFCARNQEQLIYYSLSFKWLALDHELWRVLDMADNHKLPFSIHANGAFVVRGQQILERKEPSAIHEPVVLGSRIALAASEAGQRAKEVAAAVNDLSSYL